MIYRIECECGSSGTGELHEKDMIDAWAAEHQQICGKEFTTRMDAIFRAVCPTCNLTYYGESQKEVDFELLDHFERHSDCTQVVD